MNRLFAALDESGMCTLMSWSNSENAAVVRLLKHKKITVSKTVISDPS